ncbi:MAG TPA: hypothetical protein VMV73_00760, partial [Candidatus Dormibacteraeota bacterium]|nr:hypothetical protein [Candidatus Dormibacteraeota bacterium]
AEGQAPMKKLTTLLALGGFALALLRPVPAQSFFGGLPIDGIRCDTSEGIALHIHAHLEFFDRGRVRSLPADIGIPTTLPPCLYWMHTHDSSGIVHIESPIKRAFTLGEFFDIWGQSLSWSAAGPLRAARGSRLRFIVDGRIWKGRSPRLILLHNHEDITIEVGPPFRAQRPFNWSQAQM